MRLLFTYHISSHFSFDIFVGLADTSWCRALICHWVFLCSGASVAEVIDLSVSSVSGSSYELYLKDLDAIRALLSLSNNSLFLHTFLDTLSHTHILSIVLPFPSSPWHTASRIVCFFVLAYPHSHHIFHPTKNTHCLTQTHICAHICPRHVSSCASGSWAVFPKLLSHWLLFPHVTRGESFWEQSLGVFLLSQLEQSACCKRACAGG